jgi:hypothetical protein
VADRDSCNEEDTFRKCGTLKAFGGSDEITKTRSILRQNNPSIQELLHYRTQSLVHDQFRGNHKRQRTQESRVNTEIEKKGDRNSPQSGSVE